MVAIEDRHGIAVGGAGHDVGDFLGHAVSFVGRRDTCRLYQPSLGFTHGGLYRVQPCYHDVLGTGSGAARKATSLRDMRPVRMEEQLAVNRGYRTKTAALALVRRGI